MHVATEQLRTRKEDLMTECAVVIAGKPIYLIYEYNLLKVTNSTLTFRKKRDPASYHMSYDKRLSCSQAIYVLYMHSIWARTY